MSEGSAARLSPSVLWGLGASVHHWRMWWQQRPTPQNDHPVPVSEGDG